MNQHTDASSHRPRSPFAQKVGYVIFPALIIGYLAFITYSFYDAHDPARGLGRLVVLWCLGAVAVTLLVRSWRKRRQR